MPFDSEPYALPQFLIAAAKYSRKTHTFNLPLRPSDFWERKSSLTWEWSLSTEILKKGSFIASNNMAMQMNV